MNASDRFPSGLVRSRSQDRETVKDGSRGSPTGRFDRSRCSLRLIGIGLLAGWVASAAFTSAAFASEADSFESIVQPFLVDHCVHCHDDSLAEGGLNLDTLEPDFLNRPAADHWVEVLDRINLGEMPPQDEPRPDADDLTAVTSWITEKITDSRRSRERSGDRVPLRRMTRLEYANTIRDLLHVEFVEGQGPIDWLPPDGSIGGFDRNAKALLIDPSLMETYFEVAARVADRAIRTRPPEVPQRTVRFAYRDIVGSPMDYQIRDPAMTLEGDTLVIIAGSARSYAQLLHPFNGKEVPQTGSYRVRIRAAAERGEDGEPVYMRVSQGGQESIAQFRVDASPDDPQVYEFETVRNELLQGEYGVGLIGGSDIGRYIGHRGRARREADSLLKSGKMQAATVMKARLRAQGAHVEGGYQPRVLDTSDLPKLRLDWIEVTGPLQGEYPPKSMTQLFFRGWDESTFDEEYVDAIFRRLLPRAYRRPVRDDEVEPIVSLVLDEIAAGMAYPEAIKSGLIATLCSPNFLYLFEPAAAQSFDQVTDMRRPLTAHELATRLSYFLWSTRPDDRLSHLADQGNLDDASVLAGEVERMIGDERFGGFLDGFVRQWLKVDEFDRFEPDRAIFPEYHAVEFAGVETDIARQPIEFVAAMIRDDEPLTAMLDSRWTMLNGRLATYYGIEGVTGEAFRRVDLSAEHAIRGGLLGMAGVHRWGSDGSRTKPVDRGKYVLDVLFNDPPPPPPPNAGEVEPNIRGETLTVAERLAKHREQTTCMNCHRRIDPYGLALENFNVIGHWRDQIDGEKPLPRWGRDRPAIELDGQLPNGDEYRSYEEFKQTMLAQRIRFLRGVSEKLLAYALGRSIEPSDRPLIDEIVATCIEDRQTMRSIITSIVTSDVFATK